MDRKGFTLLELLIVIAILAVLATVVVMVINPGEYLAQTRDGGRLSDTDTLNKAIALFLFDNPTGLSAISTMTVFVSLPDTSSTCGSYTLPALAAGYVYKCASSASSTLNNGQGWLPINFTSIVAGSPMPKLPVDPSNMASTFYEFVTNGSGYTLASQLESVKYRSTTGPNDGGQYLSKYEQGNDLTLVGKAGDRATNGGFDSTSAWGFQVGVGSISGGTANINDISGYSSAIYEGISAANGNIYECTFTITNYVSGSIRINAIGTTVRNAVGTYTERYMHTSGSTNFAFTVAGGTILSIDNVSIKQVPF